MLVEAIGVVAVAAVRRTPAGLHVCDAVRVGTEHAQECLRTHGACADFHVERLLNHAAAFRPILLQLKNYVLDRLHYTSSRILTVTRALSACSSIGCTRNRRKSAAVDCSHFLGESCDTGVRSISPAVPRDSALNSQLPPRRQA